MKGMMAMKVVAIDENGNSISVNQFFNTFEEFSLNKSLREQTSRLLKVMMRHPDPHDILYIAERSGQGYSFSVTGNERTYSISFEIKGDSLILITIR